MSTARIVDRDQFRIKRSSELKSRRQAGMIGAQTNGAGIMAKYVLGWFLGVPVIVLVILYLLFH